MNILVLNCGSSTVKFEIFQRDRSIKSGTVEIAPGMDHARAVTQIVRSVPRHTIQAVSHRVVHGGSEFVMPVVITDEVMAKLEKLSALAPLHNPPALEGIRVARRFFTVPNLAFFDTSFHRTMPERAYTYAVPKTFGYRRYGFHGLSHQYVMERYAELSGRARPTIITLHLGNGCSACAIREGESIDTSMGYTPLEGLVMGTRSGDIDPAVAIALGEQVLNGESGLKALAGTSDMREILKGGHEPALDVFCYRIRKYVGAYLAVLEGKCEAIVFTGGIGENAAEVRRRICAGFEWAGLKKLDPTRTDGRISTDDSTLHAWVIKTDEEKLIARETIKLLGGQG